MNIKAKYQKCTIPKGVAKPMLIDTLTFCSNNFQKNSFIIQTVVGFEIRVFSGTPQVCLAIEDSWQKKVLLIVDGQDKKVAKIFLYTFSGRLTFLAADLM